MSAITGYHGDRRTKTVRRKIRWGDVIAPYLFVLPFILFFVVLFLGPAVYSFVLSFFDYKGYGTATWVGLENYDAILSYQVFWTGMRNVFFYWIAHVIPMMALAFLLALLLRSKLVGAKRIFKPILFLPHLVAGVSAALLFRSFFSTNYGVLNTWLGTNIPWLEDMNLARWVVVIVLLWRNTGYWFIIYLAGLTAINPELEEAATVDGANAWQRMTRITLPLMRNTLLFAFVVDGIQALKLFGVPNVLGANTGLLCPTGMAPVLNILIDSIRSGRYGRASATGWLLFLVIVLVTRVQFWVFRNRGKES